MEILRERFLDDSNRFHVSLSLRSRTTEMHSLLTALDADERSAVGAVLTRALDDIAALLNDQRTTNNEQQQLSTVNQQR